MSVWLVGLVLTVAIAPVATADRARQQSPPETDNTVTRIHVFPNGTAQWTIKIRTRLDTDDRVAEYEAFQARFRNNTSRYLDPFRTRMRGVVANAANATGREMHAVNFTASTSIQEVPRRWGIVTYQFTWTNFAAAEDGKLVVGDIFQGGFFLAADDTLEIEAPQAYAIERVAPEPATQADGMVTWVGREDFADEHPRVVFTQTTNQEAMTPIDSRQTNTPAAWSDIEPSVLVGGLLLLGVIGGTTFVLWRHREIFDGGVLTAGSNHEADTLPETEAPSPTEEQPPGALGDSDIMTDPERVQALLKTHDGRMRQAVIADELEWSASKTSRVIGQMVDEGTVEKLQLGRENLIELADDE